MTPHAVITADIVNSTKLNKKEEKHLIASLEQVLSPYRYEFYRGDSFQVYVPDPKDALQLILLCRTAARSITENISCDVRSSLGIAGVDKPVRKLTTAKGEAFVLSGRAFDEMKGDTRLAITVGGESGQIINIAMKLVADYIDLIYFAMRPKQAAVVFELLKGNNQQGAVDKLKKSKSTISQLVKAANWTDIEVIINNYRALVNNIKV